MDRSAFLGFRSNLIRWIGGVRIPQDNLPLGTIVQRTVATPYTANADLSTDIPTDDTTPMDSEGDSILSVAHTPLSATNRVCIRFMGWASAGDASQISAALISSTATLAIAAYNTKPVGADSPVLMAIQHEYSPGVTTAITYSIRVGAASGGAAIRMNGTTAARRFGGVAASTLVIEEVKA